MITGFYNTVLKTENGRKYFKYQINNKIVKKEIKKKRHTNTQKNS